MKGHLLLAALVLMGCSEARITRAPPPPPVEPPGTVDDGSGAPPEWVTCTEGFYARYFNLEASHEDVEPDPDTASPNLDDLDWWDESRKVFERFDPSLEFGAGWFPVDQGLIGDPLYYAVRWNAWLRATDDTTLEFVLGSTDDSFLDIDGQRVWALPGIHEFETEIGTHELDSGQVPIEIRYAHRAGDDPGFRFRVIAGEAAICPPEFE